MDISDFQDLDPPISDHLAGIKVWFVRVTNINDAYYILNDGTDTLGNFMDLDEKDFYFDTKLEAYEASFAYYVAANDKAYPHFDDWMDERTAVRSKITNTGITSQQMKFN